MDVDQDEIQRQKAIYEEIQRQNKNSKTRFDAKDQGPESPRFATENRLTKGYPGQYELPSTKKELMLPDSYMPKPF